MINKIKKKSNVMILGATGFIGKNIALYFSKKFKIKATSKEDHYITINKKDLRHLTISLEYEGPIAAPIDKGTPIANILVSKKDKIIKSIPLYAAENLKKVNFFKSLLISLNYLIWGDV